MADKILCPSCGTQVKSHCEHCVWLKCIKCEIVFGLNNYFKYGVGQKK